VQPRSERRWILLHDVVRRLPVAVGKELGRSTESIRRTHADELTTADDGAVKMRAASRLVC